MILLYHKVALEAPTTWWVTVAAFERQMAALAAYDVVPLDQYDPANPRHAVITFDGVYENVWQYAFPLLRKWGYPFELFVTGDYIGKDNAFDAVEPLARFCTIEQLQDMARHGGRIQWHTASHRKLAGLPAADLEAEIASPAWLREQFAAPHLQWFAYPHGDHGPEVLDVVRRHYRGALSCDAGNDHDRLQLNRLTVVENTRLDRSRVTVIVANYNYGAYLPQAMESVLRQSVAPDEIILIDDCSHDGSQEIAQRYAGVARVVLNEENLGIVGNFNKAVGLATGDYIAFLGADNRMRSDYVERCKATLDRSPGAAVAYTDMAIFGQRAAQLAQSVGAVQVGASTAERWPVFLWQFPEPTPEVLAELATRNFMHGSSMYRREAFDQVGGYRSTDGPEDHNLFVRILAAGWKAVRVPHPLIEYRQHAAGQANTVLGTQLELAESRRQVAELRRQAAQLHQQSEQLRQALEASGERAATLEADYEAVRAERDTIEAHWRRADSDIRALLATNSWRITKPIRFVGLLARGRFGLATSRAGSFLWRQARRLSPGARTRLVQLRTRLLGAAALSPDTSTELEAITPMVQRRARHAADGAAGDPLVAHWPDQWPALDVSVVLHNNGRWLDGFVDSVLALDYPADRLSIHFVDNASTDATPQQARAAVDRLKGAGIEARLVEQANLGFGAGHSAGLRGGRAPFALVTNVDLTFERQALKRIVASAISDEHAAAWELRQKPYEHPKFYDPVTGETNWNSHACVLLRRTAFEAVGGYDHHLFMYGEDVELSYRLRRAGWLLRYCPAAVVFHYSYESAGQVKPLQYTGSTFANLYLRMKYGTLRQMAMVPAMALGLLARPEPYPGARKATVRSLGRLLAKAPAALAARRSSDAVFSFRLWDYELRRDGAFHEVHDLPAEAPLVSVITRTYAGRASLLREAMLSVAHQSYPNVELVVVEDGGETLREAVEETSRRTGLRTRYLGLPKSGRSAAGNAGLSAATGRWCVFLDDDDLLFADHVEVLVQALLANPSAVGAYSPSWEVQTRYTPGADMPYEEVAYTVLPVLRQPFDREFLKERNYIAIQSMLFQRRLFEERGGFDVDMDALEDWILWNVYAHENVFEYVPKLTSLFRTPADVTIRQRRNEIFAHTYDAARARFAERIAGLADGGGPRDVTESALA